MNILYVSAHNPVPARSGGQVDILNRLRALRQLGHRVHLVVTVKQMPDSDSRRELEALSARLTLVARKPLLHGLLSRLPVQMAVRSRLRQLKLPQLDPGHAVYDLLLLDSEFTAEILGNPTLSAARIAVRVHNDEVAYQLRLAEAARRWWTRRYCRMESRRMAAYIPNVWRAADALWFISSDELAAFERWRAKETGIGVQGYLLAAALDLAAAGSPALGNAQVLFVGSLAVTLNQDAIRWYLEQVHPRLLSGAGDNPGYELVVAGSTLGRDLAEFRAEVARHPRVRLLCDVDDLGPLFQSSSVFISPMRRGAGVKLKTVEAVLRGLPLVTTGVGAEGSALLDREHCRIEDEPAAFAQAVRELLAHPEAARHMRDRAAAHLRETADHARQLNALLQAL